MQTLGNIVSFLVGLLVVVGAFALLFMIARENQLANYPPTPCQHAVAYFGDVDSVLLHSTDVSRQLSDLAVDRADEIFYEITLLNLQKIEPPHLAKVYHTMIVEFTRSLVNKDTQRADVLYAGLQIQTNKLITECPNVEQFFVNPPHMKIGDTYGFRDGRAPPQESEVRH